MFYSETLLSKTGPLARVWLSANLERKLSKSHILQSNIETSVDAIVGQDQAPMALRLSGQLLLGVVRIYSRKARYLLEDCNEALMKIKMAFRPGNVDLPAGATAQTAAQLTLPDVITELDLLLPDPTLDLGELDLGAPVPDLSSKHKGQAKNITLASEEESFIDSQRPRATEGEGLLELDLNLSWDDEIPLGDGSEMPEMGRDAPPDISDTLMSGVDFAAGEADDTVAKEGQDVLESIELDLGLDDDAPIGFQGDVGLEDITMQAPEAEAPVGEETPVPEPAPVEAPAEEQPRERSESPLSSVRSSVERELSARIEARGEADVTYQQEDTTRLPSEDIEDAHHAAVSRKRKVVIDSVTEIKAKQIKAQQEDRSRILREPSFLPRDPTVLALMSLTKNGLLARSVFYPKNLAPELANLLAPEFVNRMAELKRKRDAGDEEEEQRPSAAKQPRLEIEEQALDVSIPSLQIEELDVATAGGDTMMELPSVSAQPIEELEFPVQREGSTSPQPEIIPQGVSEAEAEVPEEAFTPPPQPVSRETRHAVHVLREQFSEPNPKASVVFQKLLPPRATTRVDATKMFFEVLVLATKDAVHVTQGSGFGDIEIKQKKALWGAWAEEKDEQQIAEEEEGELEKEGGRKDSTPTTSSVRRSSRRDVVVGTGRTVTAAA